MAIGNPLNTGQLLGTSDSPTFANITDNGLDASEPVFSSAGKVLTSTGTVPVDKGGTGVSSWTDGQLLIGKTAGNTAELATLTAGPGVTINNGAASITISATALSWSAVTDNTTMVVNSGYICNKGSEIEMLLPATSAVGSVIALASKGAGLIKITQNAGQQIIFGAVSSTVGAGGYVKAKLVSDCLEIVCITADTIWEVKASQGNWDVM